MPAITTLTAADARRTLALRDLTDPQQGHHAIQELIDGIADAVEAPDTIVRLRRGNPVVAVADNYDRLGYEPDAAARDARIEGQMHDLDSYEPVSAMPPAVRDLSLAMDAVPDPELLGDRLRAALGEEAADVESMDILDVTPAEQLPDAARQRIGIGSGQHNVLLRVVLRSLDRTMTSDEANRLRDRIYAELHAGSVHQWAADPPT